MQNKIPNGILPSATYLQNNASGLDRAMRKSPEKFIHIKQDFTRRIDNIHNFESENNHLLPEWNYTKNSTLKPSEISSGSKKKVWWICLVCKHEWQSTIKNRTKLKSGCPNCYDNTRTSLHKYIEIAENLTENNNGKLPPQKWLHDNGYSNLVASIQRNRDSYSKIIQEKIKPIRKSKMYKEILSYLKKDTKIEIEEINHNIISIRIKGCKRNTFIIYIENNKINISEICVSTLWTSLLSEDEIIKKMNDQIGLMHKDISIDNINFMTSIDEAVFKLENINNATP